MRLTIITPIGPGHEFASLEGDASVRCAWAHPHAPFTSFDHELYDDTQGEIGRSQARNLAVEKHPDADWFMFLDADDLCQKSAFARFADALWADPELIAVFGAVHTDTHGTIPENVCPLDWDRLIQLGAVGTLSMGCFVRADMAREVRFDKDLDAGEDFDWYLRLLENQKWTKIAEPLVTIRTRVPSAIGPRGYSSLDWRAACQTVVDRWK